MMKNGGMSKKFTRKHWIILSTAVLVLAATGILCAHFVKTGKMTAFDEIAHIQRGEYIPNQNVVIDSTMAFRQKDTLYADFRKNFRMHYQTIGLASFPDSSRMILISEPAPYFEVDSIKSICAKFTHSVEPKIHKIGYDGKITDLVVLLGNATTENVNHLVHDLSKSLYLSDYKANTTPLPVQHGRSYFVEDNIDYQITLYEFNDWFMEKAEAFVQLPDTTHSVSVADMFEQKLTGVYFSKVPGFVAWAIAKKSDLSEQLNHIRQFTLDADLILGALSDSSTLVIIGRERESKLYELPPLNVESILLIASVSEKELSQSLDVNDLMAGKMKSGSDWCPTYLSKELENTEFGHLLTITDVLLKDWSENGTISESNYRYPSPPRFPFSRPLFKQLGLNELVYNWNSYNAMYAIDMDEGFTIYTLNRTGALPVSYFNSPERSVSIGYRYENQAYNYFSTIGCTDLARVVQYTALYQLFMDNGITYSGDVHSAPPTNKPYLLYTPTKDLLTFFKNLTDEQINQMSDTIAKLNYKAFIQKQVDKELGRNESNYNFKYSDEQRLDIHSQVKSDAQSRLKQSIRNVRSMLQGLSEDEFRELTRYLAYPRGMRQSGAHITYALYSRARKVNDLVRGIGKNNLAIFGLDLASVRNYYVGSLAKSSARYLKTPSVIVTYNDMLTTGGHNLSSGITRVHSLTGYKRGGGRYHSYPQMSSQPRTSNPSAKPTTSAPSGKSGGGSGSTYKKPASPSSTYHASNTKPPAQNIRPRGEVISTAARSQRGY